jgi:acetoin utilization deacetylase AcuC-like enzyme
MVHTQEHLAWVKGGGLFDIAALAAGGAIKAAEIGLSEPCFGLIRPPGHHASAQSAWGFCYFNNMAVALSALKGRDLIKTAYVLDIDLHYGDGTENILGPEDWVTVYNSEARERDAYCREVAQEMSGCRADIIGISAGFDMHQEDWGGRLKTEDYYEIGSLVRAACRRNQGGCFAVLEGGYNHQVLGHNVKALIEGMEQG